MSIKKGKKIQLNVHFFHKIGRDAYLDWLLSISFTFALMIILVLFAYLAYDGTSVLRTAPKSAQNAAQKALFDEKAMNDVLHMYDFRKDETKRLQSGFSGASEPSI